MASLARRIAPAAALGGVAVAVVGILDPALAGAGRHEEAVALPAATPRTAASATPQPAAACTSGQEVVGPQSMTPWGPVQVAATVSDGRLCEAHAIVYPTGDRKSAAINAQAIPMLDSIASEQGVTFDMISGATYTANAYWDSLQQLLDSL